MKKIVLAFKGINENFKKYLQELKKQNDKKLKDLK